jgi:hypothetical protein
VGLVVPSWLLRPGPPADRASAWILISLDLSGGSRRAGDPRSRPKRLPALAWEASGSYAPPGPQVAELAVGLGPQGTQFLTKAAKRVCLVEPGLDP